MSIRSPASTSGLVSPWDNLQQCSISWWPHTMLLLCRLRMAIHKEELGAWQFEERKTNMIVEVVLQQTAYMGLSFSRPHLFIIKFTAYNFILLFIQGKKPFKGSCLGYSHHCGIFIIRSFCSQEIERIGSIIIQAAKKKKKKQLKTHNAEYSYSLFRVNSDPLATNSCQCHLSSTHITETFPFLSRLPNCTYTHFHYHPFSILSPKTTASNMWWEQP